MASGAIDGTSRRHHDSHIAISKVISILIYYRGHKIHAQNIDTKVKPCSVKFSLIVSLYFSKFFDKVLL